MLLSPPVVATRGVSAGLNLQVSRVSGCQLVEKRACERLTSQSWKPSVPEQANRVGTSQLKSTAETGMLVLNCVFGLLLDKSQSFTEASFPADRIWSCLKLKLVTKPVWASSCPHTCLYTDKSQSLSSPFELPETNKLKCLSDLLRLITESVCPSRADTKGLANILSSLAAFTARVYSLALAKGCRFESVFFDIFGKSCVVSWP
mmetsp:Transcript_19125/g.34820  ORF Transcript_19125/g.34820 Transcript_19125/m.34820 type:complete len:204 (-) Transcript_19125:364-975(-)